MELDLVRTIRGIKGPTAESSGFSIPIRTSEGTHIGNLRPIDTRLSCQPDVVEKLTQWRRMFMHFFLTQFPATEERTAKWLEKVVLPADDRILFLISNLDDRWVGNFGVCNIRPHSVELDNLIRGESVSEPQFILYAELAMLSWLYFGLGIDSVTLHVFSNNIKTIKLHSKVGFVEKHRSELSKIQEGNEIRYLIDSREVGEPADFTYIEMEMQGPEFERHNPWVKAAYADLWR